MEPKVFINFGLDKRQLAVDDAVQLIVIPIVPIKAGRSHRLLSHLTLIHVSRRLVEVHEGDMLRQH